jgi:hypothetical protein
MGRCIFIARCLLIGAAATLLALAIVGWWDYSSFHERFGHDRRIMLWAAILVSAVIGLPLQTYALWASDKLHEPEPGFPPAPRDTVPVGLYVLASLMPATLQFFFILTLAWGAVLHAGIYVWFWTSTFIIGWVALRRTPVSRPVS